MRAHRLLQLALLAVPLAASAQDSGTFAPQAFHPAMGPHNFVTVEGPRVEGRTYWSATVVSSYERNPFTVGVARCNVPPGPDGACPGDDFDLTGEESVVENQFVTHLMGTISLMRRLQIGLDLPLSVVTGYVLDENTAAVTEEVTGLGLSDPRVEGRYRIFGGAQGFAVAGALALTLPMADLFGVNPNRHLGAAIPTFVPRGIVSWRRKKLEIGANLFADIRYETTQAFSSDYGTAFGWGFAGSYQVTKRLRGILEVFGSSQPPFEADLSPVETDLAAQMQIGFFTLLAGGGVGLTKGIGSPDFRLFLGATFYPYRGDRDHDGIDDARDQCKDEEEDEDGFLDSDGCPEEDNDADGLLDAADRCPDEAEDEDEFQDTDGCPDPDNDGDGVADGYDSCVNVAEDEDGDRDDDGCPDDDTDGDGVNDIADRCPTEAEDTDGSADEDGCPDPDNDGDGVPDTTDQCDGDPEDRDGVRDEDGCPEPEGPRRRGGGH